MDNKGFNNGDEKILYPNIPDLTQNDIELSSTGIKNEKSPQEQFYETDNENIDSISQIITEKKDWKYFWKRVISDLKNKNLIPVKVLFFFKYATLFVLYPFLTLHMNALGLDEWEIGINQATAPIVAILGPPFAGVIADKIGNFKVLLSFLTLLNAGTALLLLLVPVARENVDFLTFEISCNNNNTHLQSVDTSSCSLNNTNTPWYDLPNAEIRCGIVCPLQNATQSGLEKLPRFSTFSTRPSSVTNGTKIFELPDEINTIEFISNKNLDLICTENLEGKTCFLEYPFGAENNELGDLNTSVSATGLNKDANVLLNLKKLALANLDKNATGLLKNVTSLTLEIQGEFSFNGEKHDSPMCFSQRNSSVDNPNCSSKCIVQFERKIFCTDKGERRIFNVGLTFGMYTLFRLMLGFASATSFIMFEGAVLAIMKQYGGDYGLQRVSATLAAIISAPLSGMLLQRFGFRPVFYLYAALQAFSALLTLKIDLHFKKPSEKVISNLKDVLSQPEILIFFVAMLWSGTAWGFLETFLFLFLQTLGGSTRLMGLTISVGGLSGLPLLIFSRPIIKRLGHVNVLCLGLLFYCFRYIGYSMIENPWLCLPFEIMEAVTASLAITAASTYAVALSNLQTIASIQGIMGCLYFGLGRGAGSLIGGILIKKYGHRLTFQIFGLGSLVGCVLYTLINILYIRRHSIAHRGLDINNLDSANADANQNGKTEERKLKNGEIMPKTENRRALNKSTTSPSADGGNDGPLDINKFTNIPLDEETNSNSKNNKSIKRL